MDIPFSIIRPATICGFSDRQRLDLAVNLLTSHAIQNKKMTIFGGEQHRPNLNIKDKTRQLLENNLLLFFTGYTRLSSSILKKQDKETKKKKINT